MNHASRQKTHKTQVGLLVMSVKLFQDEQKLKVDSDLENKLLAMESVIDHHLLQ